MTPLARTIVRLQSDPRASPVLAPETGRMIGPAGPLRLDSIDGADINAPGVRELRGPAGISAPPPGGE